MLWYKHNFLYLHIVEDIISFDRLTQWHELIRHETTSHSSQQIINFAVILNDER